MAKIAHKLTDLIGHTPLLQLDKFAETKGLSAHILVKLESFNPAGSVKDRAALAMIEEAEKAGKITKGALLIEPTSGNTGIGLAMVAKVKGYKLILTMPETMSVERRNLLAARGAQIVLTPGSEGMAGAVRKAEEIQAANPGSLILQQFENEANPNAHVLSTGPEILEDTDGDLACFVAGVGTGGTVSGVGQVLKQHNASIKVVAVEPADSPLLSGGKPGPHKIQGIGANFIPGNYHKEYVDEVMQITTEQAFQAARELVDLEGVFVGISSGAAVAAAVVLAQRPEFTGKRIVVLCPDGGDRYLSTPLFERGE